MLQWIPHRRVMADAARIGILTAAVKLAGAGKTMVSARFFGAGRDLDAYLIAFLLPSFLSDVLAGAIVQATMPELLKHREHSGHRQNLYASILYTSVQVLSAIAILVALASPWLLKIVASGFDPGTAELTRGLLLCMVPILPLSALSNTWKTVLNANERFLAAALVPILTPLVSICALLVFGQRFGITTLALSTVTGATLECITLALAVRYSGYSPFPKWAGEFHDLRPALRQYFPLISANLLMGGSTLVDQSLAATLGAGSVSSLNLGTRVLAVILAVGPTALGTATFPRLSRLAAAGDWATWRNHLRSYALIGLAVTVPLTAVLVQLSTPIVRVLFERGAFTAANTAAVSRVQSFAFLQIPTAVILSLLVKAVSSRQANYLLLRVAVISLLSAITFDFILMRWFGTAGIALASTGVQAAGIAVLLLFLSRQARDSQA
jgi:putative peptidoglycan lipid II flippase